MKDSCSGVILAGGLSKRFSGKNKALLRVGDKRILDHILNTYTQIFNEIILVTNDPVPYTEWDIHVVTDVFNIQSPLTGIHAGLFHMALPYGFFTACDTPFLKKELIETIIDRIESQTDVIIPDTLEGLQPLSAVYAKRCLKPIESYLKGSSNNPRTKRCLEPGLKIQNFFSRVTVQKIHESLLRDKDPDLVSFFNINTPEDLARAEVLKKNLR